MVAIARYGISILLFIGPIKMRVMDQVLFRIFYSSREERTIKTGNEIKFPILNSFIHPLQERLSCCDCNWLHSISELEEIVKKISLLKSFRAVYLSINTQ